MTASVLRRSVGDLCDGVQRSGEITPWPFGLARFAERFQNGKAVAVVQLRDDIQPQPGAGRAYIVKQDVLPVVAGKRGLVHIHQNDRVRFKPLELPAGGEADELLPRGITAVDQMRRQDAVVLGFAGEDHDIAHFVGEKPINGAVHLRQNRICV